MEITALHVISIIAGLSARATGLEGGTEGAGRVGVRARGTRNLATLPRSLFIRGIYVYDSRETRVPRARIIRIMNRDILFFLLSSVLYARAWVRSTARIRTNVRALR